ncbi:hypothetical protein P5673_013649 [Acropora cervicornis]|uniref:Uncharacterized protein n=1 Tax=Acropora cervicornis TaxID=6130 RepID=A0AAD9QLR2_ACRCE|nr:hypothetical protein P5673_013649 [Acropora cervicornis]
MHRKGDPRRSSLKRGFRIHPCKNDSNVFALQIHNEECQVANAVGAALSLVSTTSDHVVPLKNTTREKTWEEAEPGKKYLFFGEYFCPAYFFGMSKSSINTKAVLTITDMTESTELLALKRQKEGYKAAVKFSCVFVLF